MEWINFVKKTEYLLGKGFELNSDEDSLTYQLNGRDFNFKKEDYDRMIDHLNKCETSNYMVYDDNNYEVVLEQGDKINRRIIPNLLYDRLSSYKLNDDENNIEYKFQEISDIMILNIMKHGDLYELRRPIFSSIIRDLKSDDVSLFDLLRLTFRNVISLNVNHKEILEKYKLDECINSFLFNLCYKCGISYRAMNEDDNVYNRGNRLKVRLSSLKYLEPPHLLYKRELTEQYHMAISSIDPFIQFIGFYHIMEYFFEEIYKEDVIKNVKQMLIRPDFSVKKEKDILNLVDFVNKKRIDSKVGTELEALELTLTKFVDIDRVIKALDEIDKSLILYYKDNKVDFSDGIEIDINSANNDIFKTISKRIYNTRNALVHNKSNMVKERCIYEPFKDSIALSKEIPLLKVIAEEIIMESAEEL